MVFYFQISRGTCSGRLNTYAHINSVLSKAVVSVLGVEGSGKKQRNRKCTLLPEPKGAHPALTAQSLGHCEMLKLFVCRFF